MPQLHITEINELDIPASGNKFHGFATWTAKTDKGRPVQIPKGLGVVVTANGVRSFCLNYVINGRERRVTIGQVGVVTVPMALQEAKKLRGLIENKIDPLASRDEAKAHRDEVAKPKGDGNTVRDIWLKWEKARIANGRKRDPLHQRKAFNNHILPLIGDTSFKELRKSDLYRLRDAIRDKSGPAMANRSITYLMSVLNWQARREDEWTPPKRPVVEDEFEEVERDRTLTEDEIRALWSVFEESGKFGQLCQLLLLTGCRRSEIGDMMRQEIDWQARTATIPATRYKTGKPHVVALSEPALAILRALPERADGRMFPALSYVHGKEKIEAKLPGLARWTLHDLRRTARTLMSPLVAGDIAERVLGHAVKSEMARIYDQHDYTPEKLAAVDKLAARILGIVNPDPTGKVVQLHART
jgi:integrase